MIYIYQENEQFKIDKPDYGWIKLRVKIIYKDKMSINLFENSIVEAL